VQEEIFAPAAVRQADLVNRVWPAAEAERPEVSPSPHPPSFPHTKRHSKQEGEKHLHSLEFGRRPESAPGGGGHRIVGEAESVANCFIFTGKIPAKISLSGTGMA